MPVTILNATIVVSTAVLLTSSALGQGTWEEQQAYAEKQTASYLASYPTVVSDRFVFKTVNIPSGNRLALDLRVDRPNSGGPFSVVFFVHGGGWITGSKAHFCHQSFELAKHGFMRSPQQAGGPARCSGNGGQL